MNHATKKPSFAGIDIYIGIDVHKNNWTVCILVNDYVIKHFRSNQHHYN